MTPDFSSATHELAAALIAAFPQLSFEASAEDGTLTILAGCLQLVVSPAAKDSLTEDYGDGIETLVAKPAVIDFEAIPVGGLTQIEFLALCKARVRAQNDQRAFPKDASYREALDRLTARWGGEIKAQRAAASVVPATQPPAQEYQTGVIQGGRRDGMDLRST